MVVCRLSFFVIFRCLSFVIICHLLSFVVVCCLSFVVVCRLSLFATWLVLGGTGSVEGRTGWMVHGGTWSV